MNAKDPNKNQFITSAEVQDQPLRECVKDALDRYFEDLDGEGHDGLYKMLLAEVERPLFESVLNYCNGNQTQASNLLGLNRGTLRKKLKEYDLA